MELKPTVKKMVRIFGILLLNSYDLCIPNHNYGPSLCLKAKLSAKP